MIHRTSRSGFLLGRDPVAGVTEAAVGIEGLWTGEQASLRHTSCVVGGGIS